MERHTDLVEDNGTDLEDFGMGHLDDKAFWIYGNALLTATTTTTTSSSGDMT
jgi:hypothetical protein